MHKHPVAFSEALAFSCFTTHTLAVAGWRHSADFSSHAINHQPRSAIHIHLLPIRIGYGRHGTIRGRMGGRINAVS